MALQELLLSLVVVLMMFGWRLPEIIDSQEFGSAIAGLETWQLLPAVNLVGMLGWLIAIRWRRQSRRGLLPDPFAVGAA